MIADGTGEIEKLFQKVLQVCIKEDCSSQTRKTSLFLSVERHSVSIPLSRKELVIRLTDDSDPFFLYTLNLGEEDFQSLKTQQGLLVDSAAFPQKFTELLELCLQEEQKEKPRFLLSLSLQGKMGFDAGPAQLNVIETNPFKHLTHLSLQLVPASDINVKKYLAKCLKGLKEEKDRLESYLHNTETDLQLRLSQCQESLAERTRELEKARAEFKLQLNNCERRHLEELATEKDRLLKDYHESEERWNKERKEMVQNNQKRTQQLEARVTCLDSLNKELQEKQYKQETTTRELRTRLLSLEDEVKQTHQRLQSSNREKSQIESELHEQGKVVGQLKSKLSHFEQESMDKDLLKTKLQEQFKTCQEQKKKLEETLEHKQILLSKRESSLKSLSDELNKGNEIIRKLQAEIHNCHGKLQIRGKIAMKQEEVLGEKEEHLEHLQEELKAVKEKLKEKDSENKQLSEALENTNHKLEECDKQVKVNENVIKWLNKQLTNSQINQPKAPSLDPASTVITLRQRNNMIPPTIRNPDTNFISATIPSLTSTVSSISTLPKTLTIPTSHQVPSTLAQGSNFGVTSYLSGNPPYRPDAGFTTLLNSTPSLTLPSTIVTPSILSAPLDQRYFQRHTTQESSHISRPVTSTSIASSSEASTQLLAATSQFKSNLGTMTAAQPLPTSQSVSRITGQPVSDDCVPRTFAPCPSKPLFSLTNSSTPLQPS